MPELQVKLFGRAILEVDGIPAGLTPTTTTVLTRLIVADGAPVGVDDLYRDAWQASTQIPWDYRTQVQKRILEIRRAIDLGGASAAGGEPPALSTERGRLTAYRLRLPRETVDVFRFADLVSRSRASGPADGIDLLEHALALWDGEPLRDVAGQSWAAPTVQLLTSLRLAAMRDLKDAYEQAGRYADALGMAERIAGQAPGDRELTFAMAQLREQLRASRSKPVIREEFTSPRATIVVMCGDLFAQDDANLVIGFTDTFDTDTDRNIVISAESTQGVLLRRLYDGDRRLLDRELRAALAHVPRESVERRSDKRRGKLTRYPVGTVAPLPHGNRCVFAVAYSRIGNDFVAQSSMPELRTSLENLWEAVRRRGLLKPVAMPLVGSSLSRTQASPDELLHLIVSSFLASSDRHMCPELRIVVQQPVFDKLRIPAVLAAVRRQIPVPAEGRPTSQDQRRGAP